MVGVFKPNCSVARSTMCGRGSYRARRCGGGGGTGPRGNGEGRRRIWVGPEAVVMEGKV